MTVVNQGGAGNLIAWGGASPIASASTMSYGATGDIANTTVIPAGNRTGSGPGGSVLDFAINVNAVTSAGVVVDVVGYFIAPQATPLSCTTVQSSGTGTSPNNTEIDIVNAPACAAGYTAVSHACGFAGGSPAGLALTQVGGVAGYFACIWRNQTGTTLDASFATALTVCCRVPGR